MKEKSDKIYQEKSGIRIINKYNCYKHREKSLVKTNIYQNKT